MSKPPRARYRTTNWPAYNALLKRRGSLMATSLLELAEAMQRLQHALADAFARCDFILTPATAALPWAADEPHPRRIDDEATGPRADAVFTPFVNAAGLPAITLPCGMIDGLPVAFQLVGQRGSDARLLAMAQAYELLGLQHQPFVPRALVSEIPRS